MEKPWFHQAGMFELGFFSPGNNSSNRYVGIWYHNITVPTYVWVANRELPLTTKSGVLRLTEPGNLALFNETNGVIIWSSNAASRSMQNPAAQLLDSGNLVVKDGESFIWQSFDYPTNTYLPGMMSLGWNFATGVVTYLSSWRTTDDPAPGNFTIQVDPTGYPQILLKGGKRILHRLGPWNGEGFSGKAVGTISRQTLVMNKTEGKFRDNILDPSIVSMIILMPDGVSLRQTLNHRTKSWITYSKIPSDSCDNYNLCGGYGRCNIANVPHCGCLERFVPKDVESWKGGDRSGGCVRRVPLSCQEDVFLKYSWIKLPDARNSSIDEKMRSIDECEEACSRNCLCVAYAQLNISGSGSGCLFYHGDLIDIRTKPSGQDLYIRMAFAEREIVARPKGKKRVILLVSSTSVVGIVLLCLSLILAFSKTRKGNKGPFSGNYGEEAEVPFFSLSAILKATDHFSVANKLGEGGFGTVYKV